MTDTPLTFAVIQAMDDETLNLMIEATVYGRTWTRYGTGEDPNGDRLYEGRHPDGFLIYILSHDLAYTVHADKAWALLWRYGIGLAHDRAREVWSIATDDGRLTLGASTEAEVRRCICELALWQAMPHAHDIPTTTPPEPRCVYCGHTELAHGQGICFGTLQCRCKGYVSRERPLAEKEI